MYGWMVPLHSAAAPQLPQGNIHPIKGIDRRGLPQIVDDILQYTAAAFLKESVIHHIQPDIICAYGQRPLGGNGGLHKSCPEEVLRLIGRPGQLIKVRCQRLTVSVAQQTPAAYAAGTPVFRHLLRFPDLHHLAIPRPRQHRIVQIVDQNTLLLAVLLRQFHNNVGHNASCSPVDPVPVAHLAV